MTTIMGLQGEKLNFVATQQRENGQIPGPKGSILETLRLK